LLPNGACGCSGTYGSDTYPEADECGICGGSGPVAGYDCDGNCTAEIGDVIEGGYLFYIHDSGEHGLVCALEDIGGNNLNINTFEWGCYDVHLNIGTGFLMNEIGVGYQKARTNI
jgi:hypothetical protein